MATCIVCNLCDRPGTLTNARERQNVPCNVRAYGEGSFEVWRCNGCGSLHSADDADLNYYYSDYPPHRVDASKLNFVTRIGCRRRLRILTDHGLKTSHRVLDYGCGGGMFLRFLAEKGSRGARGYDAFVPDFADRGVLDESYDAVVSWDVIEHTDEPREFFRTLSGLLRPGGLLAIGTPNADRIHLGKNPLATPELHQPYHRHILSESTLTALGWENGLAPIHRHHRLYMDSPWPFINTQFLWEYTVRSGGFIDAVGERPRLDLLCSPGLLVRAFFGYLFPGGANMIITFRKQRS
jgi:SAM-dependent methyltransferase